MPNTYRDPDVAYRQPGMPYRGVPELLPSIDLQRLDNTEIRIVDKYGAYIDSLPASLLSDVEWKLNDKGETTVDVSTADDTIDSIALGERELQVVFNDAPRADGTPEMWWGHFLGEDTEPGKAKFQLDEIQGMLEDRVIETSNLDRDAEFEQFDIAWDLITEAQFGPNMDLNITRAAVADSGINRVRHYIEDQHPIIYDELMAFTGLQNGFDWWLDYNLTGQKIWTPAYPARGVVWPLETVRFEWGLNLVGFKRRRDLRRLTTRYWSGGASGGDGTKLEQSYEDIAASVKYGVRARAGSDGVQESSLDWLLDQAKKRVNNFKQPLVTLSIAVYEDPFPVLGVVHPGDWVWVVIDEGSTYIREYFRVLSLKWLAGGGIDIEFGSI